jgi:hypothetical protein
MLQQFVLNNEINWYVRFPQQNPTVSFYDITAGDK